MIDQNARNNLNSMQYAKQVSASVDKLTETLSNHPVISPRPISPADSLAAEMKALQRVIGSGNLIASLEGLQKAIDSFEVNEESITNLKKLTAELNSKLRILADISSKIPTEVKMNFPKEFPVKGKVDIGNIDKLPAVTITNLGDVSRQLSPLLSNLQTATIRAIESTKVEPRNSIEISNEVKVSQWGELIEAMEELKKGFNLLINKEVGDVKFPTDIVLPVEIQNWMIPQPVTHVSINGLTGFVKSTAVTVGTSITPLPPEVLMDRRSLVAYNNDSTVTLFLGGSDVTTANGIPVPAGTYSPPFDASPAMVVYGIAASSINVRVLEVSDEDSGK